MKKIIILFFKCALNIIYAVLKLFPVQNKVVMLSRQSNTSNIDFNLLEEEFKRQNPGIKVVILCKKIEGNLWNKVKYAFHLLYSMYHLATAKIAITDTYSIAISMLKHKKNLKIMQIWHSLGAIKKFGYQAIGKAEGRGKEISDLLNMHKNYTYITCASNVTKKFYKEAFNTPEEKIVVLGMPRIDRILSIKDNKNEDFAIQYPEVKNKKIILYVPTFRKEKNVKVDELIKRVDENKYKLIIKLHPLDANSVEDKYTVDKKYDTFTLMQIADYIITDYSAASIEASLLHKPLFFYLYDISEYQENRGLNVDLFQEVPFATSEDIDDIITKIEKDEYNYNELESFKEKYVETANMENTKRIVEFLLK